VTNVVVEMMAQCVYLEGKIENTTHNFSTGGGASVWARKTCRPCHLNMGGSVEGRKDRTTTYSMYYLAGHVL
jgi:hypothetical protein